MKARSLQLKCLYLLFECGSVLARLSRRCDQNMPRRRASLPLSCQAQGAVLCFDSKQVGTRFLTSLTCDTFVSRTSSKSHQLNSTRLQKKQKTIAHICIHVDFTSLT